MHIYTYIYIYHTCTLQDSVKLLLSESLHVTDSLDKALDEEIRKINFIAVTEKKKEIKHQYGNY